MSHFSECYYNKKSGHSESKIVKFCWKSEQMLRSLTTLAYFIEGKDFSHYERCFRKTVGNKISIPPF